MVCVSGRDDNDMDHEKIVIRSSRITLKPFTAHDADESYVCITPTGDRFEVNPKLSDSDKRLLLINKTDVIGKKLQIMFYEYTDKRIPFHILNNLVRDYE